MKFFNLFIAFLMLGAFHQASAASMTCAVAVGACPNASDTIVLRMSGSSNAHAGLADLSPYTTLVCCSGISGLGNSCSGNFETFDKLSGATNAHSRTADLADYPGSNNACISAPSGDTITVGYQDNNCDGYQTAIISMTAGTNAHVGEASAYTKKICASISVPASGGGSGGSGGGSIFGGFFGSGGGSTESPAVPAATITETATPVSPSTPNGEISVVNSGLAQADFPAIMPQASGIIASTGALVQEQIGSDDSNKVLGETLAAASIFGIDFTPKNITLAILALIVLILAFWARKAYSAPKK